MYHPVISLKNSAFYPQSTFLCFVKDIGTNNDYFPTQYQQTGLYNRMRLLCGTNRIFKCISGSNQAFKTCGYHRPPTAEGRFRSQVSPCEICDDKVTLEQVFLRVLQVSPASIIPPVLQTHHLDIVLTRTGGRELRTFHIAMPFRKSECMHIEVISLFKPPPPPSCHYISRSQLNPHVGLLRVTVQNVVAYLRSSTEVQIVALASHITSLGKLHRSYTVF